MVENGEVKKVVYVLTVEWDGGRPPTTWYNRLAKIGFFVRGDKEVSPLTRRFHGGGVVCQEGSYFCNQLSQARTLGQLARQHGAKVVTVMEAEIVDMEMTEADAVALERIQAILGKKGRSPALAWVVSCHDEMKSYATGVRKQPVCCPACGSTRISTREGAKNTVSLTGKTIWDKWFNSRFCSGNWEEPDYQEDAPAYQASLDAISTSHYVDANRLQTTHLCQQVKEYLEAGDISLDLALRILDCGFALLRRDTEYRLKARIRGLTYLIKIGWDVTSFRMAVEENDLDAVDVVDFEKGAVRLLSLRGARK